MYSKNPFSVLVIIQIPPHHSITVVGNHIKMFLPHIH